ncbi:MAG TPA: CBS domain-containing protein, partial [Candidatus Omnitrophota bacterium]|nr:CBS domain-containing protein [Candidatus Omnitrophota bacterium]
KVSDLMRKDVVTVQEDTPVYEVAHIMLSQNVRRVPVIDRDGKMTGIVSRSDVLEVILKG